MAGKRRSKGSAQNSKQSTPVVSDDESSSKSGAKGKKGGVKSSADICAKHGLVNIEDNYTDADRSNLTSYGLFVRMVRPQVQCANPKITPGQMSQVMEAKWHEFKAYVSGVNAAPDSPKTSKQSPRAILKRKQQQKEDDEEERRREEAIQKAMAGTVSSDSEVSEVKSRPQSHVNSEEEQNYDDSDEEEIEVPEKTTKKARKSGTPSMKVKMAAFQPLRQSKRDRRSVKYDTPDDDNGSDDDNSRSRSKRRRKDESSDDYDDEDDIRFQSKKRSSKKSKQSKKLAKESSESDAEDSEEEINVGDVSQNQSSMEDYSEEEDSEESDQGSSESSDLENKRRRKKLTKKKSGKAVIPGERKSERSKKGVPAVKSKSQMSDREFEKMLLVSEEEDDYKPTKKKKKRRHQQKKKKDDMTKAERVKGTNANNDGNESDHNAYCEDCGDGGDLLLCDTCRCAYHQKCAKLETIPDGQWSCPMCIEDVENGSDVEIDNHDVLCKFCKERGECLLCDFCTLVFHPDCLNPPLKKIPEGMWKCPYCWTLEKPLKGQVKDILTWRWDKQLKNVDEFDHTHSPEKQRKIEQEIKDNDEFGDTKPQRQFFVRYKNFSYWDCEWITQLQLGVFHPNILTSFHRRWDPDEAPCLEDGSSTKKDRKAKIDPDADPYKLEEKFYRYGVNPDWLIIRRVIAHDGTSKTRCYLVLWRDQSYEEATWEDPKLVEKNLALAEEFKKQVDAYWKRRKDRLEHKRDIRPPKKSLLKKTLEKQPDYLDVTGGKLHPYQLEGFNWLRFSWSQNTNTILADEMGLGKTVQSISFIYSLWKEGYLQGPFLISAPLTTVANWEREFEFWAPDLYVVTYLGSRDSRALLREYEFSYKEGAFAQYKKPAKMREGHKIKFDVLLTSYEFVSMDYTTLQSIDWDILVIDEAHRLKNQQSLYFRTLLNFSIDYKLLLTGTPLQNNLEELFNLLNFLERLKFTNMDEFLMSFEDISKDEQVNRLHEMLAPHMLRRLKIDVMKDLPDKKELIVRVELSEMQKKFYKHILTKNFEALNVRGSSNSTSLMNIMMDLRKCCNHPYLFPAASMDAPISRKGLYEGKALTNSCGKLTLLNKMLQKLKEQNHRVLIFSQMTRLLDLLEDYMLYKDYNYERIDGNISGKVRQASIDRFNSPDSDSFVFLLSTRAGGLGINLATADTVIIYDMDWNPHNDIQAFSRAHRIGQKNKVMIYRFVSRSTVEERITQTAKKKMMLTELVIHRGMGQPQEKAETLNKKEINDILKFGAEELFADESDQQVHYDDAAVEALLDRSQASDSHVEDAKAVGVNEYLRSFKVASYTVKETNEKEEEEEKEPEQEEEELEDIDDPHYWQRVLGSSYTEHKVQMLQEEERRLRSMGKGKRIRRQVNYAEVSMAHHDDGESGRKTRGQEKDKTYNVKDDLEGHDVEQLDKIEELIQSMSDYEADMDDEEDLEVSSSEEEEITLKEKDSKKRRSRAVWRQVASPLPGRLGPAPKKKKSELPPLLAKVNGHEEVLGFTARQRRSFLDAVMRYGMPPEHAFKSQWLVRDLRMKSEAEFRAYAALFMRHMCEFLAENEDTYSDGVPREGISRQHILTRIGMLALVRRKVNEFEKENGIYSMSEFKSYKDPKVAERKARLKAHEEARNKAEQQFTKKSDATKDDKEKKDDKTSGDGETGKEEKNEETKDADVRKEEGSKEDKEKDKKDDEADKDKKDKKSIDDLDKKGEEESEKVKAKTEEKPKEGEDDDKQKKDEDETKKEEETEGKDESEKKEKDDGVEKERETDGEKKEGKDGEDKEEETPEKSKDKEEEKKELTAEEKKKKAEELKVVMRERFYIADGNFTELHALWQYEEQYLVDGKEYEVWHRRHDFWLLAGVVTHGYRHWQDILNDPRFSILNKAFRTDSEIMRMAAFLNRRFQLLEQALVIEEQLRKAIEMDNSLKPEKQTDHFQAMDHAAAMMRKLANRPASDPPLPKQMDNLLGVMENLVGDVRKMTYTTMPATLARPAVQQQSGQQQQQRSQARGTPQPGGKKVPITID